MGDTYEILEEYLGGKRNSTISNDEACMLSALVWSAKSKDPSTQVGVCFVNEEGRVISTGYNGTPNDWSDEEFPWENDTALLGEENTKYPYVIHAEMNGIVNYNGPISDFKNSTMYVTLFPCVNCAKLIIQAGIKKVIYLCDTPNTKDNLCSKILLKKCGVECIDFKKLKTKTVSEVGLSLNDARTGNIRVKKYI